MLSRSIRRRAALSRGLGVKAKGKRGKAKGTADGPDVILRLVTFEPKDLGDSKSTPETQGEPVL
jgi:hypothetical protein